MPRQWAANSHALSVSLSPRQLIILYKTEKEAEQAPLQNNLPGGSSPQSWEGVFKVSSGTSRLVCWPLGSWVKRCSFPMELFCKEEWVCALICRRWCSTESLEDKCTPLFPVFSPAPLSHHPHGLLISSQAAKMVSSHHSGHVDLIG